MQRLLNELATMSGLRDRREMDSALVKLLGQNNAWSTQAIQLIRAVGTPDDQRWFTCAKLDRQNTQPQCDQIWADRNALPLLADDPLRLAAVTTKNTARSGFGPVTTVFPIGLHGSVSSLLEIQSDQPLTDDAQAQINSLLCIYQHLQGLLDYGEKDSLTELLNRKTFDGAFLNATVEQHREHDAEKPESRDGDGRASYWLAVIDIDHFKRVNDNFGHLIGDEVLLLLAQQMRQNFRLDDQLYRFGGEEFVVLMRCMDHADAGRALERFRANVEAYVFPQVSAITVSIGFASVRPLDTPGSAFDRADKALYHAKAHGRNQVCSYVALVDAGLLIELAPTLQDAELF